MSLLTRLAAPLALMTTLVAVTVPAADRSETRAVSGFTAIALAAPLKVDVVQGAAEGLVLEGDERALADLETVVEQGVLKIRTRSRNGVFGMSKVRAHVSAKAIDALRIAGSGDVMLWARESLTVSVVGSGDVRFYGDPELKRSVIGSGSVRRMGATPS